MADEKNFLDIGRPFISPEFMPTASDIVNDFNARGYAPEVARKELEALHDHGVITDEVYEDLRKIYT